MFFWMFGIQFTHIVILHVSSMLNQAPAALGAAAAAAVAAPAASAAVPGPVGRLLASEDEEVSLLPKTKWEELQTHRDFRCLKGFDQLVTSKSSEVWPISTRKIYHIHCFMQCRQ